MTPPTYVRPLPKSWWLHRRAYLFYIVRELTSLFVAGYVAFLLLLVARANSAAGFSVVIGALRTPWSIALHLIALAMLVVHAVTWINLTPKVIVLWRDETRVSPALVAAANYAAWFIVSVVVAWVVLA